MDEYINSRNGEIVYAFRWNGHNLRQEIRPNDLWQFRIGHDCLFILTGYAPNIVHIDDVIVKIGVIYFAENADYFFGWEKMMSQRTYRFVSFYLNDKYYGDSLAKG